MIELTVFTDGAARGNPGAAGIGVVVCDAEGTRLAEISEYIGETTNNVAEYTALIRGLEEALRLGAGEVRISTDSELMARQLCGVYRVKSLRLKALYDKAVALLRKFRRVSITHVAREENRLADQLARSGARKNINTSTTKSEKSRSIENEPAKPVRDDGQTRLAF